MSDNKRSKAKHSGTKEHTTGIAALTAKQIAAAIVCFAVVLGMKNSPNVKFKNYADSLGKALRHDTNWEETVSEAISKIKNYTSPSKGEQNVPTEQKDGADFR